MYRDNPSEQLLWHVDLYEGMWTRYPLPETAPVDGVPGVANALPGTKPIENVFWKSMRSHCLSIAEGILKDNGFVEDSWSLQKTSRAVAAALQTASLHLRRIDRGEEEFGSEPFSLIASSVATSHDGKLSRAKAGKPLGELVQDWWLESKAAGLKPSTYESYRNTFSTFIKFLGFSAKASELFGARRRLDAWHHNPSARAISDHLGKAAKTWASVEDLGFDVWLPTRFKRVAASEGLELLDSSDLFEVNPDITKRIADQNFGDPFGARVKAGWLLLSRSGQIYGLNGSAMVAGTCHEGKVVLITSFG